MKGDFSRVRFNKAKRYTAVLQQQGRVALDADANEQSAINADLRATETIDVVGPFGGPAGDAGFAVSINGNTIQIGAGRYYVRGLLCENPAAIGYTAQPCLINPPLSDTLLLSRLQSGAYSAIQVFLEVWQRLVTSLDDPCLLEPALGRADTTARLQTVWRVVAEPVVSTSPSKQLPLTNLDAVRRAVSTLPISEVLAGLPVAGLPVGGVPVTGQPLPSQPTVPQPTPAAQDCCVTMYQPPTLLVPGKLNAQTSGATSDCSCQPTPAAGYRGLENQFYRVEIHQAGTEETATFKWSRENGSVVVGITNVSGSKVSVDSLGMDANLGFAVGQWVEISDDTSLFGVPANQPGRLYQIQSVTPGQLSVTVTPPVVGIDAGRNARMRRWDQFGPSAGQQGISLSSSLTELENGIQVQFSAGGFAAGDYWLIPARTASGQIDWPPCGGDGALFQPPRQTEVFRAPLACIHWVLNQQFAVEDCRRLFPPLTSVAGGATTALHVSRINWSNDDVMPFDQLLAAGLTVSLDQPPTSRIDASTFRLTLETPVISQIEPIAFFEGLAPIVLRNSAPLDGQISVNGSDVTWNIPFRDPKGAIAGIQLEALLVINAILMQGINYSSFARVRIRLTGRNVFAASGSSQIFLDGQAFGASGFRSDGVTPRQDLTFPSGAGDKASDFESWFFLAPTLMLAGFTVAPSTVVLTPTAPNPAAPVATLTLNYPALADTTVTLSVVPPAGALSVVTIPASVVVPKGKSSTTFPVGIGNTQNSNAQAFELVASLKNALGLTSTLTATVTVSGYVVIN